MEWDFTCRCVRHIYGYYDTGRGELESEDEAEALAVLMAMVLRRERR
ncbi:MAG: hypothetical protein GXN98_04075 [Euryarchaeota archaeon]|nr:hypothetical protein [Euryarchaeota archaeon]